VSVTTGLESSNLGVDCSTTVLPSLALVHTLDDKLLALTTSYFTC
jgi:hypothetical protein